MPGTDVIYKIRAVDKATKPVKNVTRGFKKADVKAKTLNNTIRGIGATMGKVFAVLAVFKVAKDIVTLGVNMEQTRVAFATFLGDAEKANVVIAKLNEFANVTPFNNAEVIKSGRVLLAAGVPAEALTTKLKAIGDVASGANVPLTEMGAIYAKAMNKGKLQAEELNQLAERGVPILDHLSNKWKKSKEEVIKMGSAGKITSAVMENAFQEMTSEGGIFFNMMEKQSKTLGGRFSTLVGTLQVVGIGIGEALIKPLGSVVDALQSFVGFIRENAANILRIFQPLRDALNPLFEALDRVSEKLGLAGKEGSTLENIFNALGAVIEFISPLYEAFFSILGAVIEIIVDIGIAFQNFIEQNEGVQKVLAGLGAAFKATFTLIRNAAVNILGGVAKLVSGILGGDWDQMKEGLKSLGTGLAQANPYAQGANAAFAFKKGYEKGLGPAEDFFAEYMNVGGKRYKILKRTGQMAGAIAGGADATGQTPGGLTPTTGTTGNLKAGISEVKAGAPKTFNINIHSLIEALTFNTQTIKDSTSKIEDEVKRTLLTVLADAQTVAK